LREPEQRYRLLARLFENTTPTEVEVAAAVAARFTAATGFPPVLSGDTETTRLVIHGNPYVLARNLAFNREHDGPVVVVEPYLMNQPETLARLLAGDYEGERLVAGRMRISIFREYARAVAEGLVDIYAPASTGHGNRPEGPPPVSSRRAISSGDVDDEKSPLRSPGNTR
jgi:hypothetical protein